MRITFQIQGHPPLPPLRLQGGVEVWDEGTEGKDVDDLETQFPVTEIQKPTNLLPKQGISKSKDMSFIRRFRVVNRSKQFFV